MMLILFVSQKFWEEFICTQSIFTLTLFLLLICHFSLFSRHFVPFVFRMLWCRYFVISMSWCRYFLSLLAYLGIIVFRFKTQGKFHYVYDSCLMCKNSCHYFFKYSFKSIIFPFFPRLCWNVVQVFSDSCPDPWS